MSLISELWRRNVIRVAAAYAGVAWLLLQVADVVFPIFGAPGYVRLSFACSMDELENAIGRIKRAVTA